MKGAIIDVWTVALEAPREVLQRLEAVLSSDEIERANKFRFSHLRDSYVVARGTLRHVLSGFAGVAPHELRFRSGAQGKPSLDPPGEIKFNLSHSAGFALIGVTSGCEIGVDIERHRHMPDLFDIARRYFCPEELADLESVPVDRQVEAFFLCWTRKEAYIKAIGEGLHAPLDQFQVTLKPEEAVRFVHVHHDPLEAGHWALHNLEAPASYAAAIAYRGPARQIRQYPVLTVR